MTPVLPALVAFATSRRAIATDTRDDGISKTQANAFDTRTFATPPGRKPHACVTGIGDANHLTHHPKSKFAMPLVKTAECADGESAETTMSYSFQRGAGYRYGDFDFRITREHALAIAAGRDIRLRHPVDGGTPDVALSSGSKFAIVRLQRITVRHRDWTDDSAVNTRVARADGRHFQFGRADAGDRATLLTDRKERAAIRHRRWHLAQRHRWMLSLCKDATIRRRHMLRGAVTAPGAAFACRA
jgi:hypothetical protein